MKFFCLTLLVFLFNITAYATDDGMKTQTIMADGVGSDVESASQNAAENALMQVVGTFGHLEIPPK